MAVERRFGGRVFELRVEDAEFHPGHRGVPGILEGEFSALLQSVERNGVQTPVEVLCPQDAEARGEPENAGKVVDGPSASRRRGSTAWRRCPPCARRFPKAWGPPSTSTARRSSVGT